MYNWILENNAMIQTVLSFLSLITTGVVSFMIYWLQRQHEKEVEKIQEDLRKKELENQANVFLIDNEDERDYLPWCVLASNLHRHDKHTRKIYKNFCRCSDELQNEILKMANFSFRTIPNAEWVNTAFDNLRADIEKHKLGRDVLYDGAKYFHRGFDNYQDHEWPNIEFVKVFEPIAMRMNRASFFQKEKLDLSEYIVEYFDFLYSEYRPLLHTNNPLPPIDYMCQVMNFGSAPEDVVCAWVMELVEDLAIILHNSPYTKKKTLGIELDSTDAQVETYEDKYYEALQMLYNTYYFSEPKVEPKKNRRLFKK